MKHVFAAFAVIAGVVLLSFPAAAGMQLCNRSKAGASVAVGYFDEVKGWSAQGWWSIAPGACQTLLSGKLAGSFVYILADGGLLPPPKNQSGGWFCTDRQGFVTHNNDYADKQHGLDCEAAGLKTEQFRELRVPGNDITFNLK